MDPLECEHCLYKADTYTVYLDHLELYHPRKYREELSNHAAAMEDATRYYDEECW